MVKRIRCAVVGQSNSILSYGYAAHLTAMPDIDVASVGRVGMSSALLGPFFVQPGFCAGLDFCLIDLAMFEHSVKDNRGGRYDFAALRRYLRHVMHVARADGCCPLLIAFSPAVSERDGRWHSPLQQPSEITELHREVAGTEGCPILDWTEFMQVQLERDPGLTCKDFYTDLPERPGEVDGSHPKSAWQAELAVFLRRYMTWHLATPRPEVEVVADLSLFRPVFLADVAPDRPVVHRTSGILSRRFVTLQDGDGVASPAADDERLAGYAININACSAFAWFAGDPAVVKDLHFPASLRGGSFRYHIAPVFRDCGPREGRFGISAAGDGPATEEGILRPGTAEQAEPDRIEIEAVVLERFVPGLRYVTRHLAGEERHVVAVCLGLGAERS